MNDYADQTKVIEHKLVLEPDQSKGELDTVRYQLDADDRDVPPWRQYFPSVLMIFL